MADQFISVVEVAKRLKLHTQTIYRQARAGKIKATRVGRSWRILWPIVEQKEQPPCT